MALFPLGALVVHQLRYVLAFGSDSSRALADQGHAYVHGLTPWIVLAVALGLGELSTRLARAWRSGEADRRTGRCLVVLWGLASAGLFSLYVGQEFLEGLFAAGHPGGLAGILGDGGLWALPASIAVGGVLALIVRGGGALVVGVARMRSRRPRGAGARAPKLVGRADCVTFARLAPLAAASAGRAPPCC